MQNTYLKAFLHLRDFGNKSTAATWLTRIMVNECLMILRRQRREGASPVQPEPIPDKTINGETQLTMKEMKLLLEQAIASLAPRPRRVFMLREIQKLSTAETAACLSLSPANVRVILHRAHEEVKAALVRHAASAELFSYPATFCDPLTARVMRSILAVG
jgi:RNA polymerase sigma-70 factor (ECF subfamily)